MACSPRRCLVLPAAGVRRDATPTACAAGHRACSRQRADSGARADGATMGSLLAGQDLVPDDVEGMLAVHRRHLRRQAGAHGAGLPCRALRRRPRPAVRVPDRPAQFPAPAADVGLAPRVHGRGRALRGDDDDRHRARSDRRRDIVVVCGDVEGRGDGRPLRGAGRRVCRRSGFQQRTSTRRSLPTGRRQVRSAITASSVTPRSRPPRCRMAGEPWSPSDSRPLAGKRGTTTATASRSSGFSCDRR